MHGIMFRKVVIKCGGQKLMSSKVDVLSKNIRSQGLTAIQNDVDAQTFEKAVWKVIKTKDYEAVINLFDEMGQHHHLATKSSTNAAMTAYGMLRKTTKVKKLFLESPTASTDSHSVYLLLHSYCVADRLDMVEFFMNDCLGKYVDKNPTDQPAATLLSQLYQSKNKNLSLTKLKSKEFQEFSDVQFETIMQSNHIPLYVWSTLIRLYSGRNAWVQCLQILDYIEGSDHYKVETVKLTGHVHDETHSENQLVEQIAAEKNLDLVHDFSHLISEDSVSMQHSILYHHAIRALCASSQYFKVLDVLGSMRKRGVQPQINAIVHMLSVFTRGSPSNTLNVTYHNYAQLGEVALSLKPDILLSIHKLGAEFSKAVVATNGLTTDYTHTVNYQTAAELTNEYVTVLSKVNQTLVAEQFILFLHHEYPPLLTSRLMTPLIERYKQLGQWEKAQGMFMLLSKLPKPPVGQRLSQQSMAYHHVTEGLRSANKMVEMAQFIQTDINDTSDRLSEDNSSSSSSIKS